ncbi:related to cytochrome P450 67 [Ramularia collo-cygni]|uniref:Related to cytochrome P450 67 n=1 Tax=Ramularia collo-cygni TaxID=112498 RepID=A0A2D3UWS9_9PEZI|nr:related to cytochrome P450 67 [Ramularia collo-cygni]CZT19858.1 related to cytochrome P450 67 [Ramularia collo-cygni]
MDRVHEMYQDMAQDHIHSVVDFCTGSLRYSSIVALLAAILAAITSYIIYQLYFHPLASYPGPLLGRLTRLYDVYHAYIGDKHILFYHLHKQYGTIVRFSPNSLSINDPAALKVIYAHGANVQKSEFYKCFRAAPQAISTLLATERQHHARKRRIMGQAFADSALRGFEQYVVGHVEDLVDRIGEATKQASSSTSGEKQGWSLPMDMASWSNWLVFDIMGDLVFGRSFNTLKRAENRRGIYLLGRAARRNYVVAAMPTLLYTGLEKVFPLLRGLYLDRCQYLAFGKKQVMERTKEGGFGQPGSPSMESGRRDIFSFLLHAKDPETGEGMPMAELWMEANTLIVAGSDTTSTTLSAVLYYLLHNTHTLRRLEQEVRGAFSSADEIVTGSKMQSCTYLRACIDETMRMTPPVGGILPREVLPGGLAIPALGVDLPAGIDVGVPIYAIHHHEEFVTDPFTFDPSRWLPVAEGEEAHKQDKDALMAVWNPFSLGHRGCLGKPLVYMELCIAIARMVWDFDMRVSAEQYVSEFLKEDIKRGRRRKEEYQLLDWFMSWNQGPWVDFRRRSM